MRLFTPLGHEQTTPYKVHPLSPPSEGGQSPQRSQSPLHLRSEDVPVCGRLDPIDVLCLQRIVWPPVDHLDSVCLEDEYVDLSWLRTSNPTPPETAKTLATLRDDIFFTPEIPADIWLGRKGESAKGAVLLNSPRSALVLAQCGLKVADLQKRPIEFFRDSAQPKASPAHLSYMQERYDLRRMQKLSHAREVYGMLCRQVSLREVISLLKATQANPLNLTSSFSSTLGSRIRDPAMTSGLSTAPLDLLRSEISQQEAVRESRLAKVIAMKERVVLKEIEAHEAALARLQQTLDKSVTAEQERIETRKAIEQRAAELQELREERRKAVSARKEEEAVRREEAYGKREQQREQQKEAHVKALTGLKHKVHAANQERAGAAQDRLRAAVQEKEEVGRQLQDLIERKQEVATRRRNVRELERSQAVARRNLEKVALHKERLEVVNCEVAQQQEAVREATEKKIQKISEQKKMMAQSFDELVQQKRQQEELKRSDRLRKFEEKEQAIATLSSTLRAREEATETRQQQQRRELEELREQQRLLEEDARQSRSGRLKQCLRGGLYRRLQILAIQDTRLLTAHEMKKLQQDSAAKAAAQHRQATESLHNLSERFKRK